MSNSSPLTILGQHLESAYTYSETIHQRNTTGEPLKVSRTGKTLTSVYEQLRNAAEYSEGRIVLERAIKRFYKRTLFIVKRDPKNSGQELIADLVLGGYVQDGQYSITTAASISELAIDAMKTYGQLRQAHVPVRKAQEWTLSVLSVRTEDLLRPYAYTLALVDFTYQQFLRQLPKEQFLENIDADTDYETCLYVAVHQALLKSDVDIIRADIVRLQHKAIDTIQTYIALQEQVDAFIAFPLTQRLRRLLNKNVAPYRILKDLIEGAPSSAGTLTDRDAFLNAYSGQIKVEYRRVAKRLNKGLIKSIIFLLITKGIIGIGVEVPFDLVVYGTVAILPLAVNLLFPPVYMASIRLGLAMPTNADAHATKIFMDELLYGDGNPKLSIQERTQPYGAPAKVALALLFLTPFALTVYVLRMLHFNLLQMAIFFVFFSTASFLGFVLSSMVRELKMARRHATPFSMLFSFFYLPFILFGRWLAGKYARFNFVGTFLDMAIELPLKTLLRLIRQWTRFMNEKYEEFY